MKQYSEYSQYPDTFIPYTNDSTLVNYNVEEITKEIEGETITMYKCEYVIVNNVTEGDIVDAMLRTKYSMSQEFAILRQRDSKSEEFNEYNTFAEQCKTIAKSLLVNN